MAAARGEFDGDDREFSGPIEELEAAGDDEGVVETHPTLVEDGEVERRDVLIGGFAAGALSSPPPTFSPNCLRR